MTTIRHHIPLSAASRSRSAARGTVLAAVSVVLFVATACSSGSTSPNPARSTRSSQLSSPPSSPPAAASGSIATSGSSPTATITQADLDAALLGTADIGSGFKLGTYQAPTHGGPCETTGTPSVDQRIPPEIAAGRTFDSTTANAAFTQEAAAYVSPAEAARAFALAVRGTSCRHGTLTDGSPVTISPGQDVTAQINDNGLGKSTAWQFANPSIRGVIVATLSGRVADACIFVAAANVNTSKLINPIAVAKVAFDKLLAH